MPPEIRDAAYLHDMLEASLNAIDFSRGMTYEQYLENKLVRSAVERQIEIVGEAARHVSASLQEANPHIPWEKVRGTRHRLAHEYGDVDHEVIWRIVSVHLPSLVPQLREILPPQPESTDL